MSDVKTVLRNARKIITSKGWVKGDDHRIEEGESKFCARGAVYVAAGAQVVVRTKIDPYSGEVYDFAEWDNSSIDWDVQSKAMDRLATVAQKLAKEKNLLSGDTCNIVGYNDLPATTVEDVLEAFDEAIRLVEAEELVHQYDPARVAV